MGAGLIGVGYATRAEASAYLNALASSIRSRGMAGSSLQALSACSYGVAAVGTQVDQLGIASLEQFAASLGRCLAPVITITARVLLPADLLELPSSQIVLAETRPHAGPDGACTEGARLSQQRPLEHVCRGEYNMPWRPRLV